MSDPHVRSSDLTALDDLFCRALEHEPAARAEWLGRLRAENPRQYTELVELLAAHESTGPLDELRAVVRRSTPAPSPAVPDRIGAYEVVELIARGGMGAVYLGHRADQQPGPRVAIKLMRSDADALPLREHFLNEGRILARIEHPNIARFLDGGFTTTGQPYFVMEYVDGQPIDRYCVARALSLEARLALFRSVCHAVQHAHQHLVVHRDIKPANVFVGADGVTKLLDFGIARAIDPDPVSTPATPARVSLRLLTPEYASPEQKAGERVTTASDVYQLGLLLRLLVTGSIAAPSEDEGVPDVPRDVQLIVAKATHPEPARRYASAEHLANDVQKFLSGLAVVP